MKKKPTWAQRNPERFNEMWRRWYYANQKKKVSWQKRRHNELRAWWWAYKATKKCERCGETTPECLQFHHKDPTQKEVDLGLALAWRWKRERILAEAEKCEVLCANCHLKHHWEERAERRALPASSPR
ncbi:MAG TPA: hypothetical protein VGM39_06705 [Kofleriaceae bacterium]|jgi:ribosomal protein L32